MNPHLAVAAARALVPPALIGPPQWDELCDLASALPACAASVGFECRLSGGDAVDLGLSVARREAVAAILAGRSTETRLSAAAAADARWRRLRAFARAWTDADSPLAHRVPFAFLEVDAGRLHPPAAPSVFLALDWLLSELGDDARDQRRRAFVEVVAVVGSLRAEPFDAATAAAGLRAFDALPSRAFPLHAGAMIGRTGEALRLSMLVPRDAVPGYLDALGRGADRAVVAATLARFASLGGFGDPGRLVQLDFDPTADDARLGITLRPDDDVAWPALLQRLVADGLCTAARGAALLCWPGTSIARVLDDAAPVPVTRTLEHVKLVCASGQLGGAKAYFGSAVKRGAAAIA